MNKKLLLVFIGILAITVLLSGCGKKVASKSELVDIFKNLDSLDFQAQSQSGNKATADKLLKQIYVEPQLSKAIKYVDDMRNNHVRLELYDIKYDTVDVLDRDENSCSIHVESSPRGDYFTLSTPSNKLGPLEQALKYDLKLKKVGEKWYISDVTQAKPQK